MLHIRAPRDRYIPRSLVASSPHPAAWLCVLPPAAPPPVTRSSITHLTRDIHTTFFDTLYYYRGKRSSAGNEGHIAFLLSPPRQFTHTHIHTPVGE